MSGHGSHGGEVGGLELHTASASIAVHLELDISLIAPRATPRVFYKPVVGSSFFTIADSEDVVVQTHSART